jgi:hypothetical protein
VFQTNSLNRPQVNETVDAHTIFHNVTLLVSCTAITMSILAMGPFKHPLPAVKQPTVDGQGTF